MREVGEADGRGWTPGQLIRRARRERGVSQAELAVRAGTTQSAISRLESDLVSPTIDHLMRLLLCLGCELTVTATPLGSWADEHDLRSWQARGMDERLTAASSTLGQLAEIAGAARDR